MTLTWKKWLKFYNSLIACKRWTSIASLQKIQWFTPEETPSSWQTTSYLVKQDPKWPHRTELRMQKLKTHLLRTKSLKVLPCKSGAGPYIAMHATPSATDFFLANFYPSGPFTWFFFQNPSQVFSVLAVANISSCVGPQNKIGHLAYLYKKLQVPVLCAQEI